MLLKKERILSGMRPTGSLHLGHYVGALVNWVGLQDKYECFYMIADWHALMSEYANPSIIPNSTRDMVADWLAVGLDPGKSAIFRQSDVREHAELHMILSAITPISWLERCPTYKEQLRELAGKEVNNYAFLGYPVLQAADITLYKTSVVPVGEDQVPHVELTREIVRRFNYLYKKEVLIEPKAFLTKSARLPGLDGRKMSKSYGNSIEIGTEAEEIRKKVMTMLTDVKRARLKDQGHPDECNLYPYYEALFPSLTASIRKECVNSSRGCTECKCQLAEEIIKFTEPMRKIRNEVLSTPGKIDSVLSEGADRARNLAIQTMKEVRGAMGF
ncbi:MAG: tryptophan--tRNA ligase [Planctomycetota bacterium]